MHFKIPKSISNVRRKKPKSCQVYSKLCLHPKFEAFAHSGDYICNFLFVTSYRSWLVRVNAVLRFEGDPEYVLVPRSIRMTALLSED